ncbi:GntR family transcriptional regulator [Devosia insulae DS-56]|uniref:GntR family transcriptional regulator n=1 Tax=Devosia insulae DS-56 TaxID=1116389 RepID=A0A1E5XJS6_9HYPH|nr:GntR family transcriptional regulator [Devosia insulae DS-56]
MIETKSLQPLTKPQTLHASVQESLKAYIDENRLRGGDPLPPESFLAQQLAVSRNSVREAIKALESVGILETRRGIGVFVRPFSFDPLLEHLAYGLRGSLREVGELVEIRRVLEVALIEKTVEMIGEDDLAELRAVTDRMRVLAEHHESFADEDKAFHLLLFRCQGNQMLSKLIDVFWLAFYKASDFVNLDNPNPLATWKDHHDIVEAVAARDVEAARARLDHHYHGILGVIAKNGETVR